MKVFHRWIFCRLHFYGQKLDTLDTLFHRIFSWLSRFFSSQFSFSKYRLSEVVLMLIIAHILDRLLERLIKKIYEQRPCSVKKDSLPICTILRPISTESNFRKIFNEWLNFQINTLSCLVLEQKIFLLF